MINMFKRIIIDKYTGPEITEFSDLEKCYGTGQAYLISRNPEKKYRYRSGVQTNIGDIEEKEWCSLVKELIKKKGETELFNMLSEWGQENGVRREYKEKITLELHASRIFDDEAWCDFIPFNEKYRPEKLKTASIVTVSTDCCNTKLRMTEKQIARRFNGQIYCHKCKQYTTFTQNKE